MTHKIAAAIVAFLTGAGIVIAGVSAAPLIISGQVDGLAAAASVTAVSAAVGTMYGAALLRG